MIETLLDSFNAWTDAQGIKSKGRVKSVDNISLEGIDRLRELILILAVNGTLVKQISTEEPAKILLKKIDKERGNLISKGIIRKEKLDFEVSKREHPYDLPKNWVWFRLAGLMTLISGQDLPSSKYNNKKKGVPYITGASHFNNGRLDITRWTEYPRAFSSKGDLLITCKGTIGEMAFNNVGDLHIARQIMAIRNTYDINLSYIKLFLDYYINELISKAKSLIPGIKRDDLLTIPFPLPPLKEQNRIVAKVGKLMALCDQFEHERTTNLKTHQLLVKTLLETLTQAANAEALQAHWERMANYFDTLFCTEDSIEQLKQTILQLGIMGKLIKQDPKDEPAGVLLKKIDAKKKELIEKGEIKPSKTLPEISIYETPFGIPNNWKWARLGDITTRIGSGSTPRGGKSAYLKKGTLFLRSQNIWNDGIKITDAAFISKATHEKMSNTKVYPKDILLNITGGSLGRCCIFPEEYEEANVSQHVSIIRPVDENFRRYLHIFILSPLGQNLIWGRQVGANREGLSKKVLELFEIPIPPLKEQKRIVAKIDELLGLCDSMANHLIESQKLQNLLAKTLVEKAVL
ncbi:restriction endonuclease subunit S [Euzebyella saccharophila]|uniref:Restriction endonuclease subunit S n=1 Tax=Euzebyella saccharophila TaxID=679664 RepID=A0ABV8JKF9_9FLAO|nr:restriction endonuclease subunit S [Euzebyella saccharophila]